MDEQKTRQFISKFFCKKDRDIENFLKNKAIEFEKRGKSRTFFIYNEDSIGKNNIDILAYFTLALQILHIPENLSKNKIRKLDGFSSNLKGNKITEIPVILIGQLGKNDLYSSLITGSEIIQFCFSKILEGQERLGGRVIMLECKNVEYLKRFYAEYDFKMIDKNYTKNDLIQFVKILSIKNLI
jgi:hypothetical protein